MKSSLIIWVKVLQGGGVKFRANAFIEGGNWKTFEISKELSY